MGEVFPNKVRHRSVLKVGGGRIEELRDFIALEVVIVSDLVNEAVCESSGFSGGLCLVLFDIGRVVSPPKGG